MSDTESEPESELEAQPVKPPWVSHCYFVVPDASGYAILMLPSAEGWRLPYVRTENLWVAQAGPIRERVISELAPDFDFTILRYVAFEENEKERWSRIVFVLEPLQPLHQSLRQPPFDGQWVDRVTLNGLPLAFPDQRAPLLHYLAENEGGDLSPLIDPRRAPWARVGWFATASAWIEEAIREVGYIQNGPVQQLRNWSISCLLTVPTSAGKLFFKVAAALPYFVNEPALMQSLAHLYPDYVPAPLKIDREQRWMLMHDYQLVEWDRPIDVAPIMTVYGELQRASAEHLGDLVASGCIDRRLPILATHIDSLIADPETRAALTPEEYAILETMAPALKQLCAKVATYTIPPTLIHGDLHPGNITRHGEGYSFFDWTDACIGFPFLDHFMLYFEIEDVARAIRGRDSYLASWRAFESPERRLELWQLARPLCALHHAVSYLVIIKAVEPSTRDELFHGFPDNLRRLIACT